MEKDNQDLRLQTLCLLTLTIIAIAAALTWLRPVMIPFILAVFFSLILTPLIDIQIKHFKLPRTLAIFTTLIIGFLILGLLFILVSTSVGEMATNADSYQQKLQELLNKASTASIFERFDIDLKSKIRPLFTMLGKNIGSIVGGTVNAIVGLMSQAILVLIFVCFLLVGRGKKKMQPDPLWLEAEGQIKRYLVTKVTTSAITAILVWGVLVILNVDLALVFGLFVFVLNFIPSFGSMIATFLPLPVVIISPESSSTTILLALLIPGVIQFTIGNVIEPKIMGESLNLHPVSILMALIFWGIIWGIVGMFLAVPLTAIMKIIFEKIELTKPLADLLAGGKQQSP